MTTDDTNTDDMNTVTATLPAPDSTSRAAEASTVDDAALTDALR